MNPAHSSDAEKTKSKWELHPLPATVAALLAGLAILGLGLFILGTLVWKAFTPLAWTASSCEVLRNPAWNVNPSGMPQLKTEHDPNAVAVPVDWTFVFRDVDDRREARVDLSAPGDRYRWSDFRVGWTYTCWTPFWSKDSMTLQDPAGEKSSWGESLIVLVFGLGISGMGGLILMAGIGSIQERRKGGTVSNPGGAEGSG